MVCRTINTLLSMFSRICVMADPSRRLACVVVDMCRVRVCAAMELKLEQVCGGPTVCRPFVRQEECREHREFADRDGVAARRADEQLDWRWRRHAISRICEQIYCSLYLYAFSPLLLSASLCGLILQVCPPPLTLSLEIREL